MWVVTALVLLGLSDPSLVLHPSTQLIRICQSWLLVFPLFTGDFDDLWWDCPHLLPCPCAFAIVIFPFPFNFFFTVSNKEPSLTAYLVLPFVHQLF